MSTFTNCSLGMNMQSKYERCIFDRCTFRNVVWTHGNVHMCTFVNCKYEESRLFRNAIVSKSDFIGELNGMFFTGAVFRDARRQRILSYNNLSSCNFGDAVFGDVSFHNNCDLSSVLLPHREKHQFVVDWDRKCDDLRSLFVSNPKYLNGNFKKWVASQCANDIPQRHTILNLEYLQRHFGNAIHSDVRRIIDS